MRLFLLLLALVIPRQSHAEVEITNFRSGLACTNTRLTSDAAGWICQPTEDVLMTDQGVCIFDGVKHPCTWIGFEFDYKGARKGTKLQCVSETSAPVDEGNPERLLAKDVSSQPFELDLDSDSGHFFNPQYFVFGVRPEGGHTLVNKGYCKSNGRTIFEYRFNILFPITPK